MCFRRRGRDSGLRRELFLQLLLVLFLFILLNTLSLISFLMNFKKKKRQKNTVSKNAILCFICFWSFGENCFKAFELRIDKQLGEIRSSLSIHKSSSLSTYFSYKRAYWINRRIYIWIPTLHNSPYIAETSWDRDHRLFGSVLTKQEPSYRFETCCSPPRR